MFKNKFKRNINYIKTSFYILYKKTLEYKVNLLSSILVQISFLFTMLIFFYSFNNSFGDIIGWEKIDFILFLFITDSIWSTAGIIIWNKYLTKDIISGNFNNILIRPTNTLINYIFKDLQAMAIIMNVVNIPILIYLTFNINTSILNLFIAILIFIFLVIMLILFMMFLSSFNFHFLHFSSITVPIFGNGRKITKDFPYQLYATNKIRYIMMLWPTLYASSILIPFIQNKSIINIEEQIIFLIAIFLIFSIGLIINWKKGLQKYSAFG